jgi:hypothetical protein
MAIRRLSRLCIGIFVLSFIHGSFYNPLYFTYNSMAHTGSNRDVLLKSVPCFGRNSFDFTVAHRWLFLAAFCQFIVECANASCFAKWGHD